MTERKPLEEMQVDELRGEIVRIAMGYVFGDYPDTDDLDTKANALWDMELACMELDRRERRRGSSGP